jgi:hypothetical protein
MSIHHHHTPRQWSTEIYRVRDHASQQRILQTFREDVVHRFNALGTSSGPDWFVIVDTSTVEDRLSALQTIFALDSVATRVHSSKPAPLVDPLPAS